MHWSAQYPGYGFTQPGILSWLPFSIAWSNVAAGHLTTIQTISKLREDSPSIYMNGIYKDNAKLPNYQIRYAYILHNTCTLDVYLMSYSYFSQDNIGYYTAVKVN
jgi:hypothetical protein